MSMWLRMWCDVLDDRRFFDMPPELFRRWVFVLMCAKKHGGRIPPIADLCWSMRLGEEEVSATLADLERYGLVDSSSDGLKPHNWDGRQYQSDLSTSRVQKHREKLRGNGERNVSETPPEQSRLTEQSRDVNPPLAPPPTEPAEPVRRAVSSAPAVSDEQAPTVRAVRAVKEPAAFTAFYGQYPRKENKPDALKAWLALKPDGETADAIIGSLPRWRLSDDWTRDGGRYIPLPATFLRGRRWEDEPRMTSPPARSNRRPDVMDVLREAFSQTGGSNGYHPGPTPSSDGTAVDYVAAPRAVILDRASPARRLPDGAGRSDAG